MLAWPASPLPHGWSGWCYALSKPLPCYYWLEEGLAEQTKQRVWPLIGGGGGGSINREFRRPQADH